MKKIYISLFALFCFVASFGQTVASYNFSQSSTTYTPITGGTLFGTAVDNAVYGGTAGLIPFTFTYRGNAYTSLRISTNGFITLGNAITPSASNYLPISSTATSSVYVVSALGRDLNATVRYEVIGTAPNRVAIIQWSSVFRYAVSGAENLNFQIQLNETSNLINIVYGSMSTSNTDFTIGGSQVGLKGAANTDFNVASFTSATLTGYPYTRNWSNLITASGNTDVVGITSTILPASGTSLNYLPSICAQPTVSTTATLVTNNSATLNWTNNVAYSSGYNVRWRKVDELPSTPTWATPTSVAAGSSSYNVTGLTGFTYYIYSVEGLCSGSSRSNYSQVTTANLTNARGLVQTLANPCSGAPISGTATTSVGTVCSGATVNLNTTGGSTELGITYQWQSSPAGVNTFTNIAGATTKAYTTTVTANTDYQCVVTCTASGLFSTSTIVTVNLLSFSTVTTIATPATYYIGSTLIYSLTGLAVGPTYAYQWQNNINGAGFNNIAGATSATYEAPSVTAVPTSYQCIITACTGTLTTTSSVFVVTPTAGYCVPATTAQDSWISAFSTTGGVTNITHTAAAGATGGYINLTATTVSNYLGQTTNFSVTAGGPTVGFAIWVDWNNNNEFETTERVFVTTAYTATSTGTIAIPGGTANGIYRMRVFTDYNNSAPSNPCATNISRGEYKDFTFAVVAPPACTTPTALINSSITSVAANHAWTAPSPAPAVGYEWAVTTSATPPASGTATTGTTASSTTLSASTTFYLHVRSDCGAGSFSPWATSASFTTPCASGNIPYIMPISAVTIPSLPLCTSIENIGNLPNTWISNSFTNAAILAQFTMPVMAYGYNSTNPANDWLYTNGLNLTAGTSYTLKFKYSNDLGTAFPEAMKVAYGSANNAASMTNVLADYPVISSPTATTASIVFSPTSSGVYYVGFHAYSDADQDVLILDDVEVILTPTCIPVSGLTVTSSTTTADLSWTAVPSAVNGYEYVIDAVATSPSGAGTPVATTSVSVPGTYTLGVTYYAHVRSICSVSDFSTWTNLAFVIPPTCTTNLTPTTGSTNLSNPIPLSWNAATGATSYNVFLSSDAGATYASVGNVTGTTANLSVLNAGSYSWYVQPTNGGLAAGCASSAFTFSTTPAPTNNICADAVDLMVSNGFCSLPVTGSLAFADSTSGLGGSSCQTSALKFDVWYKVTVPSTGNVTVQTSAVNTVVTDLVLEAYSGTCGALASIGCNDDGNTDPSPSANHSKLGLIGRTPGEVIYFRVMPYSTLTNAGAFAICAFDTSSSLLPPVALGAANACTNATAMNIDSAFKYTWATFKDAAGNVIAQVYPNGNKLGITTASFYKNVGAVRQTGTFYLDRNITITPTIQPTNGTVTVRLFYTAAELADLQAVDPIVTNANLNINKTQTACSSLFVGTGATFIAQTANGTYGANRYLDIETPSFSEFFLKGSAGVLPISIEYFKGTKQSSANHLDWKVTCTSSPSITITLERSADGRTFKSINEENALAVRCLQAFDYTDASPLAGANYYRLKLITPTGEVSYSKIIVLLNKEKGFELISIAPNPVKNSAILTLTTVKGGKIEIAISDVTGKVVAKQIISVIAGNNPVNMDFATLGAGTYMITAINADGEIKTTRFVKY
jgi:GEVED domain/Secretion system C-terminal sorting domain